MEAYDANERFLIKGSYEWHFYDCEVYFERKKRREHRNSIRQHFCIWLKARPIFILWIMLTLVPIIPWERYVCNFLWIKKGWLIATSYMTATPWQWHYKDDFVLAPHRVAPLGMKVLRLNRYIRQSLTVFEFLSFTRNSTPILSLQCCCWCNPWMVVGHVNGRSCEHKIAYRRVI